MIGGLSYRDQWCDNRLKPRHFHLSTLLSSLLIFIGNSLTCKQTEQRVGINVSRNPMSKYKAQSYELMRYCKCSVTTGKPQVCCLWAQPQKWRTLYIEKLQFNKVEYFYVSIKNNFRLWVVIIKICFKYYAI